MTQNTDLFEHVVGLGDSALILGQGLAAWLGRAPALELDIAITNLSLDVMGQAQYYLEYAGEVEGKGRSADDLAFLRDVMDFRNYLLVEQPADDFGRTIAMLFAYATFMELYLEKQCASKDQRLADVAQKAVKEMAYHRRFASEWVLRLGGGTDESQARMARGLDHIWRFTGELFTVSEGEQRMIDAGIAVDPKAIEGDWNAAVDQVLQEAGLARPEAIQMIKGRYKGHHGETLGHMLAEMQYLQRAYPGATW